MNGACYPFLARAAFSENKYRGIGPRHERNRFDELAHHRACLHEVGVESQHASERLLQLFHELTVESLPFQVQ